MFLPTLNFVGKARISIVASDTQGGITTFNIILPVLPVDDKPELRVENSTMVVVEGQGKSIPRIQLIDVDAAPNDVYNIRVSCSYGYLTYADPTHLHTPQLIVEKDTENRNLELRGVIENINKFLLKIVYKANDDGGARDKIMFFIDGTKNATVTVDVLAVNSAPVIYLPSYLEAVEDAPMNINGVYITDSDIQHTSGSMMTVNVTVENGSVSFWTLQGLRIIEGDTPSSFISFEGSLTRINYVLSKMIFQSEENFFGNASLSVVANDNGNTGTGGSSNFLQTHKHCSGGPTG